MAIEVVGGVYRERCLRPSWDQVYGSAGRAAEAIATMGTPVVLHSFLTDDAREAFEDRGALLGTLSVKGPRTDELVRFVYMHDLAVPRIYDAPKQGRGVLEVSAEKAVRFGMLDGDAKVHAKWAVYDPQNIREGRPFAENGSTAERLALVMNSFEAAHMAGMHDAHPSRSAPALAAKQNAEVVVVKMGAQGAYVWTATEQRQVPAYRTKRVWKIGSGDCFVGHFANAWMEDGLRPWEAADMASRATAYYCETQGFPTAEHLANHGTKPISVSEAYRSGEPRQVYLAGPFFDLMQQWLVEQAVINLEDMGLKVFSPLHDVGLKGDKSTIAQKDLQALRDSQVMFAIADGVDPGTVFEVGYARALNKPVVVYSERHQGQESLTMLEGSGCVMCTNYATAIYSTLWEAAAL